MKPYLAISVTPQCNYHCPYCYDFSSPSIGENRHASPKSVATSEFLRFAKIAYEEGVQSFRITGGEPLLRRDLADIIQGIASLGESVRTTLVTNGELLNQNLESLLKIPRFSLYLSLDSVTQSSYRKHPTIEKMRAINQLQDAGVPIRINMVVLKSNKEEVEPMVNLCRNYKCDLKLLDLYADPQHPNGPHYWEENYQPLQPIEERLKELGATCVGTYAPDGRRGIPMPLYVLDSIKIILKDSTRGTHLHPTCQSCPFFPCQEGYYTPLITSDGTLRPSGCWNDANSVNLTDKPDVVVRKNLRSLLAQFEELRFHPSDMLIPYRPIKPQHLQIDTNIKRVISR